MWQTHNISCYFIIGWTEFSSEVNKVLPSSLGHYTILLVSRALLPRDTLSGGDKDTVYISQYRHSLIGTKTGKCLV